MRSRIFFDIYSEINGSFGWRACYQPFPNLSDCFIWGSIIYLMEAKYQQSIMQNKRIAAVLVYSHQRI
jgi:hypothetical protein